MTKSPRATQNLFDFSSRTAVSVALAVWFFFFAMACGYHQQLVLPKATPLSEVPYPTESLKFRKSFSSNNTRELTIIAGGDVMIGHWTLSYLEKFGSDYPFRGIAPVLKSADVAFANLEAPLADSGVGFEDKKFTFKVPTKHAVGLKKAGFTAFSLANNHMIDFGLDALRQTLVTLDSVGIAHSGAGLTLEEAWKSGIIETPSGKVGLLAFSMTFPEEFWATDSTGGTAYPYEGKMKQQIDSLKKSVDFVIVSFHWGREKYIEPRDYQKIFGRMAIDAGADVVLGHHPHVLQGVEIYNNKLIAYSLGNLAFSAYSASATSSMLLRLKLRENGDLIYGKIIPLNIDNGVVNFQPQVAEPGIAKQIFAHLDSLSFKLNNEDIISENGLIMRNLNFTN